MKRIGAGLGDDGYLGAAAASDIRAGNAGLNIKLLDGIRQVEQIEGTVNLRVVVAHAVQGVVVRLSPHTSHRKTHHLSPWSALYRSGGRERQSQNIAAKHGQI